MRCFLVSGLMVLAVMISNTSALADRSYPVDQGVITSARGYRKDPFGSGKLVFHRGIDIAVATGTPVYPTRSGIVYFAGTYGGYGNLIAVDHGNGWITMYGHNSKLVAKVGQRVDTNSVIALAGSTGRSTGPHVHYEVRRWPGGTSPVFTESVQPTLGQGQIEPHQQVHDPFSEVGETWVDSQLRGM